MALYQIDVEKVLGTETWTNVYHAEAADNAAANTVLNSIVAAERPVHLSTVTFSVGRIRLAGVGHAGQVVVLNVLGTRAVSGIAYPLFNVALIDFANGTSRPARKYLRGPFQGTDLVAGFNFASGTLTVLTTYVTAILAIAAMRDPKGRTLSAGAPHTLVAMHQLRRGNRRKPVI